MASGTLTAQVQIPVGDLFSYTPYFCSHYITGRKNIRRRKNYPGRARLAQKIEKKLSQCRKLSHSAKSTLFHCGTFPYSLPKTEGYRLSSYITETILYLNTFPSNLKIMTNLYPILIHCRIYAVSHYLAETTAEIYPFFIH